MAEEIKGNWVIAEYAPKYDGRDAICGYHRHIIGTFETSEQAQAAREKLFESDEYCYDFYYDVEYVGPVGLCQGCENEPFTIF